jgi:hypothetical protein
VKARLVELRDFAGLTGEAAAEILGISARTADRYWVYLLPPKPGAVPNLIATMVRAPAVARGSRRRPGAV